MILHLIHFDQSSNGIEEQLPSIADVDCIVILFSNQDEDTIRNFYGTLSQSEARVCLLPTEDPHHFPGLEKLRDSFIDFDEFIELCTQYTAISSWY